MSRLEELKEQLRESGQFIDEKHIDWIAKEKHRHEKMKDLQNTIQKKIKDQLRGGSKSA